MTERTAWIRVRAKALAVVAAAFFAAPWDVAANGVCTTPTEAPTKPSTPANSDIYGRWRIAKVLGAADITAMSHRQTLALVGKTIRISEKAFVFDGERCEAPTYERERADLVKSFREEGHASAAHMGLPDPVTSIDARCTHIFLKRPHVIVVHWRGFYFDAVKHR